jgi:rhodanese-related sulfurtransferase
MKKITIIMTVFLLYNCVGGNTQTISVKEFEKQIDLTKAEQLIDVRTPLEFDKYHIQGAKNIDFRCPEFKNAIEKLDKTKPVLIYCLSGGRSKAALAVFRKAGFTTVYELDGGINAWSKLGKAITEDLSGKGELSRQ